IHAAAGHIDTPARPRAAGGGTGAKATGRLVVGNLAIVERHGAAGYIDAPARPQATGVAATAGGLVGGNRAIADRHDTASDVETPTQPRAARGTAGRLVAEQSAAGDGQVGAGGEDAATLIGSTEGDRQPGEGDVRPGGADLEDAAGVVAADGQLVGAQALDVQGLG